MAKSTSLFFLTTTSTLSILTSLAGYSPVVLRTWKTRKSTRKALKKLSNCQLLDVGITREAALTEARRPFWRD